MRLTVKDSTNFLEQFPVIGQEKVRIIINYRKRNGKLKELDLEFYVTEYPAFATDPSQEYIQIYTLVGISEQSYISKQKKISRKISNNPSVLIKKILFEELGLSRDQNNKKKYKKFRESEGQYSSNSSIQGIINTQSPMSAIEWLRKITKDNGKSPFFFFQTLDGKYRLYSYASMIDDSVNAVYDTYYDFRTYTNQPYTEGDYRQRATRILSVESNLKLNKTEQSINGAFASRNFTLDYATKTFKSERYNYFKDFAGRETLEQYPILSKDFLVLNGSLDTFNDSHQEYISTNSKAYSLNNNYNYEVEKSRPIFNAHHALFDTMSHDIKLHGDFKLNAGRKISLFFPKAIDPTLNKGELKNEFLSGKYIVTSAIHEFEDDEYFVNVRVKRDSFSKEIK